MDDRISVEAPLVYDAYTDQQLAGNAPPFDKSRVALLVVHGMGQQSKFDTLNQVSDALTTTFGATKTKRVARNVAIGDMRLSRMELRVDGIKPEVHVYEAYWAPITEGRVTLRDVMSFLYGGATNGLKNAFGSFRRWIFGQYKKLGLRHWMTIFSLSFILAVLLSLVTINTVIGGFEALYATGIARTWLTRILIDDLTSVALMLLCMMGAFAATLFAAGAQKTARAYSGVCTPLVSSIGFLYLFFAGLGVIITGVVMADAVHHHRGGDGGPAFGALMTWWTIAALLIAAAINALAAALLLRGSASAATRARLSAANLVSAAILFLLAYAVVNLAAIRAIENYHSMFARVWLPDIVRHDAMFAATTFVAERWVAIWVFLAAVSAWIRKFIIQYVGDVAVYVTPKTLDRFNEMREEIKTCVGKVADTIYRAKTDDAGGFLYGRVLVVAHSLGSIAAYDAVNRMLNADAYVNWNIQVCERTTRLVTFGSPLNKIAFLFASSTTQRGAAGRAALAATVQPLVADRRTKMIPWTNIHSGLDIISGPVGFYDVPRSENDADIIDYEALVPLAAHTEYWDNKLLWAVVTNEIR
ncbi:MAG: hypothetical protein ACRD3J_29325 [Thermoanaerobaculia bacterium]